MPAAASRWPRLVFTEPIRQGSPGGRPSETDRAKRPGLDGIAKQRAGPVGLDILDAPRLDAAVATRVANHRFLRLTGRGEQAVGPAVLVDRRSSDHAVDPIAIGQGPGQGLEDDHAGALAAHESIRAGIEGFAAAIRGERTGPREADGPERRQDEVDRSGHRNAGLAAAKTLTCQVHGHQRRRAGRVHRDRGPPQVEKVREPVRDNAVGNPGPRVLIGSRIVAGLEIRVVVR